MLQEKSFEMFFFLESIIQVSLLSEIFFFCQCLLIFFYAATFLISMGALFIMTPFVIHTGYTHSFKSNENNAFTLSDLRYL